MKHYIGILECSKRKDRGKKQKLSISIPMPKRREVNGKQSLFWGYYQSQQRYIVRLNSEYTSYWQINAKQSQSEIKYGAKETYPESTLGATDVATIG